MATKPLVVSFICIYVSKDNVISGNIKIARVVAANPIPQIETSPGMLERLVEMQGIQRSRISVEEREEALSQQLDLSGMEGWSP